MTFTVRAIAGAASIFGALALSGNPAGAWGSWVVETQAYVDQGYTIHYFNYVAGGRDLRVVVRGNPTPAAQSDFEAAVLATMNARQPGYQSRARFTTNHTAGTREPFKVVLVFGDTHVPEYRVCAEPDGVPSAVPGGPVRLTAVFCWRGERINSIRARVGGVASSADARLDDMVASALRGLFPNKWRHSTP